MPFEDVACLYYLRTVDKDISKNLYVEKSDITIYNSQYLKIQIPRILILSDKVIITV